MVSKLADRILEKLVPKTTAQAAEFWVTCYCSGIRLFQKYCITSPTGVKCGSCRDRGPHC